MTPAIISVYFSMFCLGISANIPGALSPFWVERGVVEPSLLGIIYSIQTVFSLVLSLLTGQLADRMKMRPMFLFFLSLLVPGAFLLSTARNPVWLATGLLLSGPPASCLSIVALTWVAGNFRSKSSTPLAILHFSYSVGAIAGPLLVWAFGFGREIGTAIVLALLCSLSILGLLHGSYREVPVVQKERAEKGFSLFGDFKSFIKSPLLWLIGFSALAYMGIETGSSSWLPLYVRETGISFPASLIGSWFFIFFTVGRLIFARIAGRFKAEQFIIVSSLLLLLPLAIWLALGPLSWLPVLIALLGIFASGIYPALQNVMIKIIPDDMGKGVAWAGMFASFGTILWSGSSGFGFRNIGPVILPLLFALQAVLFIVFALMAFRKTARISVTGSGAS